MGILNLFLPLPSSLGLHRFLIQTSFKESSVLPNFSPITSTDAHFITIVYIVPGYSSSTQTWLPSAAVSSTQMCSCHDSHLCTFLHSTAPSQLCSHFCIHTTAATSSRPAIFHSTYLLTALLASYLGLAISYWFPAAFACWKPRGSQNHT